MEWELQCETTQGASITKSVQGTTKELWSLSTTAKSVHLRIPPFKMQEMGKKLGNAVVADSDLPMFLTMAPNGVWVHFFAVGAISIRVDGRPAGEIKEAAKWAETCV